MIYTSPMGRKKLNRERINITLPAGMPKQLEDAATAVGKDRSRLIEELCAAFLAPLKKPGKKPRPRLTPRPAE